MATRITARINSSGGRLSSSTPISLRNQQLELRNVDDLSNVVAANLVSGATLVYNANTNLFEIKPIAELDGGSF